jgi:hypothetical protein
VDDDLHDLRFGEAQVQRAAEMRRGAARAHQADVDGERDQLALAQRQVRARPDVAEEMPYRELVEVRVELLLHHQPGSALPQLLEQLLPPLHARAVSFHAGHSLAVESYGL